MLRYLKTNKAQVVMSEYVLMFFLARRDGDRHDHLFQEGRAGAYS